MITLRLTEDQASALREVLVQLKGTEASRASRAQRLEFVRTYRAQHPQSTHEQIGCAMQAAGLYSQRTVLADIIYAAKRCLLKLDLPVTPTTPEKP